MKYLLIVSKIKQVISRLDKDISFLSKSLTDKKINIFIINQYEKGYKLFTKGKENLFNIINKSINSSIEIERIKNREFVLTKSYFIDIYYQLKNSNLDLSIKCRLIVSRLEELINLLDSMKA